MYMPCNLVHASFAIVLMEVWGEIPWSVVLSGVQLSAPDSQVHVMLFSTLSAKNNLSEEISWVVEMCTSYVVEYLPPLPGNLNVLYGHQKLCHPYVGDT